MIETQGNASNGFVVFNHQIEAVFVIHDCSQAHDTNVDIIFGFAHLKMFQAQD